MQNLSASDFQQELGLDLDPVHMLVCVRVAAGVGARVGAKVGAFVPAVGAGAAVILPQVLGLTTLRNFLLALPPHCCTGPQPRGNTVGGGESPQPLDPFGGRAIGSRGSGQLFAA